MLPYAGLHGNFLRNTCCSESLREVLSLWSLKSETKCPWLLDSNSPASLLFALLKTNCHIQELSVAERSALAGYKWHIRLDSHLWMQRGVNALTYLALTALCVASFHHLKDILLSRLVFGVLQSIAQHSPRYFTAGEYPLIGKKRKKEI